MNWGTYHYSQTPFTSWFNFASYIKEAANRQKAGWVECYIEGCSTEEFGAAAYRPRNSRLDNTKLTTLLGISPPDWRDYVDSFVAAYLED